MVTKIVSKVDLINASLHTQTTWVYPYTTGTEKLCLGFVAH